MHIYRTLLSTAAMFAIAAQAQTGGAPVAQVPGPLTSSPSTPFGAPSAPAPAPLPPALSPTAPTGPALPAAPSIEGVVVPVPSDYRLDVQRSAPATTNQQDGASQSSGGLDLPVPLARPLDASAEDDTVLALGRGAGDASGFRSAIAAAVDRNPALGEAEAAAEEAEAARREARSGLFPTADLSISSFETVSREFSNDINNIIERSRPRSRTDAQMAINQTLFDFGATFSRISASTSRIRAAAATIDDTASQVALRTIAAWYDIFSYRSLLVIGRAYQRRQEARRSDFAMRVDQGANAQVDIARLNSSLASLQTRLARYERQVANAEAQFTQLTGRPAPADLVRAPQLGNLPSNEEEARAAATEVPSVRVAREQAVAARADAKALTRDNLPYVSVGIDAGRYGVLENPRDYDVRARISIRQRLGGAQDARIDQAKARANGVAARASRASEEAARDASIAWSDLQALERQTASLEQNYLAARLSRDAIEARFRVSRGTLFDIIDSNDAYFGAAAAYIESLADRDAAHYVLLARTGRLLDALNINSAYSQARR